MHAKMWTVLKLVLILNFSIAVCWADTPVVHTRALINAFNEAYYNPPAASGITFDMIERAINELADLEPHLLQEVDESREGQLVIDFIISPATFLRDELTNNRAQRAFIARAVGDYNFFRAAYLERQMIPGGYPVPNHPKVRRLYNMIRSPNNRPDLNRFRAAENEVNSLWRELAALRRRVDAHENLNSIAGYWNVMNNPFVQILETCVFPFLTGRDVDSKMFALLKWTFSKRSNVGSSGAASNMPSSSSNPGVSGSMLMFDPRPFPEGSKTKELVEMAIGMRQGPPSSDDFVAAIAEIDSNGSRRFSLGYGTVGELYPGELNFLENYMRHPAVRFLQDVAFPLFQRSLLEQKLNILARTLLDIEESSSN